MYLRAEGEVEGGGEGEEEDGEHHQEDGELDARAHLRAEIGSRK